MYSKNLKGIASLLLRAAVPTGPLLKKRPGFGGPGSGIWFCKYSIAAAIWVFSIMPVNGATKSEYKRGHESATNFGQVLTAQIFWHFQKVLIAAEYGAPFFYLKEFTFTTSVILFMEQPDYQNEPHSVSTGPGTGNFLLFSLVCVSGFLSGYYTRHLISVRRRNRFKESDAEREFSQLSQLLANYPKPQPATQKISGDLKTKISSKETIQNTATLVGEKKLPMDENTQPVTLEWSGNEIKINLPKPRRVNTLYFPNPNDEGDFRKTDGRERFIEGASIYKFKLDSETKAKFEFCIEQSSVFIALNNRDGLILSVANEVNSYSRNAHKIQTIQYGEAVLDGAAWKVKTKARIRYE